MTETMKRFLTLASGPIGSAMRKYEDLRLAENNGWVKSNGYPQNSMTERFVITDEGRAALAAA